MVQLKQFEYFLCERRQERSRNLFPVFHSTKYKGALGNKLQSGTRDCKGKKTKTINKPQTQKGSNAR